MLVVFANNQTMVAASGTTAVIRTDPVALNGSDRISAIINVHTIFNTGAPGLAWIIEVSNDGAEFIAFGAGGTQLLRAPRLGRNSAWCSPTFVSSSL